MKYLVFTLCLCSEYKKNQIKSKLNPPSSLSCSFLSAFFSSSLSPHRPSKARTSPAERQSLCLGAASPSTRCHRRRSVRSPHAADTLPSSGFCTVLLNSCRTASTAERGSSCCRLVASSPMSGMLSTYIMSGVHSSAPTCVCVCV